MPTQNESRATGHKLPKDLVRLFAEDIRVIERSTKFKEGEIERDRDDDQQDGCDNLDGQARASSTSREATSRHRAMAVISWEAIAPVSP